MVHVNYLKQLSRDKMLAEVTVVYMNQRANLKDLLVSERYAFLAKEPETDIHGR